MKTIIKSYELFLFEFLCPRRENQDEKQIKKKKRFCVKEKKVRTKDLKYFFFFLSNMHSRLRRNSKT